MGTQSDDELYRRGDFKAIYDRFAAPLFRFAYRFTLNREQAEEILHDVFTQVLTGKFSPGQGSFKSWIYLVTKNRCLNHLRHACLENGNKAEIEKLTTGFDAETELLELERAREFAIAENRLPSDLRETWLLRKQGLDQAAIARELSIPVGTVKSRFHRMVKFLKKEFLYES